MCRAKFTGTHTYTHTHTLCVTFKTRTWCIVIVYNCSWFIIMVELEAAKYSDWWYGCALLIVTHEVILFRFFFCSSFHLLSLPLSSCFLMLISLLLLFFFMFKETFWPKISLMNIKLFLKFPQLLHILY